MTQRTVEGKILAPSRSDVTPLSPGLARASFAKIREPLAVPDLLALQTASFDWLLGGADWKARVAEQIAAQGDPAAGRQLAGVSDQRPGR